MSQHLFNGMTDTFDQEVVLVVEKNTKKEVNRILAELTELEKISSKTLIRINANVLSYDKLKPLVAESRSIFKSVDVKLTVALIEHDNLENIPLAFPIDTKKEISKLGNPAVTEIVNEMDEETFFLFFKDLNDEISSFIERIKALYVKNKTILTLAEEKPVVKLGEKRDLFSFKTLQSSLDILYSQCFNELKHLISPYSSVNPSPAFQRKLVWPVEKKVDFIDSLLNEIPIGSFYVNSNIHNLELGEGYGKILWDGKQRIHALHSFILNEFPVGVNGQLVFYSQAPSYFNNVFWNTPITIFESKYSTMEEIVEAYIAINKKQIKHTDEDLEAAIRVLQRQ